MRTRRIRPVGGGGVAVLPPPRDGLGTKLLCTSPGSTMGRCWPLKPKKPLGLMTTSSSGKCRARMGSTFGETVNGWTLKGLRRGRGPRCHRWFRRATRSHRRHVGRVTDVGGGEVEKARALINRRLHRRPSPRDFHLACLYGGVFNPSHFNSG